MGTSYLGSRISLISKAEIRYEGILYSVDKDESTVALSKVQSHGTEDRVTDRPVPAREEIFEYIIFRGADIKDLHVSSPPSTPLIEDCTGQENDDNDQQPMQQPSHFNQPIYQAPPLLQPPLHHPPLPPLQPPLHHPPPPHLFQPPPGLASHPHNSIYSPPNFTTNPYTNYNFDENSMMQNNFSSDDMPYTHNNDKANNKNETMSRPPNNEEGDTSNNNNQHNNNYNQSNNNNNMNNGRFRDTTNNNDNNDSYRYSFNKEYNRSGTRNHFQDNFNNYRFNNNNDNNTTNYNNNNNYNNNFNNKYNNNNNFYNNNNSPFPQNHHYYRNKPHFQEGARMEGRWRGEYDFEGANATFDKNGVEQELKQKLTIGDKNNKREDEDDEKDFVDEKKNESDVKEPKKSEDDDDDDGGFYNKQKSFFDKISCNTHDKRSRGGWRSERVRNCETFGLPVPFGGGMGRGGMYQEMGGRWGQGRGGGGMMRGRYRPFEGVNRSDRDNQQMGVVKS